jgi:AAA15 family ATPase/GTPase
MLLRFGVRNHLSIRDYAELSLVASSQKDGGADLIDLTPSAIRLLPAVVIYGANASGKTNFLHAFRQMRSAILNSQKKSSPTGNVGQMPFSLDAEPGENPTQFDCDFILQKVRYHYGFRFAADSYTDEWLYAFPDKKRQTWFAREHGNQRIQFGKNLKGQNRAIEALTRTNSLFLSAAAQNAHPQLLPLYEFFERQTKVIIAPNVDAERIAMILGETKLDDRVLRFLRLADTGVTSWKSEKIERSEQLRKTINALLKALGSEFPDDNSLQQISPDDLNFNTLKLGHRTKSGSDIYFELGMESRGTQRLLSLMAGVFAALDAGSSLFVDEIDSSLHTLLVEKIFALFGSKASNTKGAQLIATTHDTNLLRSGTVRRDQVWFTEKDRHGATVLYPLSDIKTRNSDNIERGYLQGRFGAVPFVGPTEELISEDA